MKYIGQDKVNSFKRFSFALILMIVVAIVYLITRQHIVAPADQGAIPGVDVPPGMIADTATDPLLINANVELLRAQHLLKTAGVDSIAESEADTTEYHSDADTPDAWRLANTDTTAPSIPLPNGVSIYEPVNVDMEHLAYPQSGEQAILTLPGGERLQATVSTSVTNANGDYTWRGHLAGHGDEYPVVMTYGENSVFATVTTPDGSYTLESVNGSGWIYKNPSEFELSKHGANDFLEIPH